MNQSNREHTHAETLNSGSEWTTGSKFADSGVDIITPRRERSVSTERDSSEQQQRSWLNAGSEASIRSPSTPELPADYDDAHDRMLELSSVSPISATASDKLRQVAAAVWALEQDEEMDDDRRKKIGNVVSGLERMLQDDQVASIDHDSEPEDEEDCIDEQHLYHVHDSLLTTVHEMRLRTQEQKHLHSLTTNKLETVTQQCVAQTERIESLTEKLDAMQVRAADTQTECNGLRRENHILGSENDTLRSSGEELQAHIKALEAEVQRQAVALTAMNSALTGLEGWMEYSGSSNNNNNFHNQRQPSRDSRNNHNDNSQNRYRADHMNGHTAMAGPRTVVRGKGRFRGRYQVDVDDDGTDIDSHGRGHHHQSRFTDQNYTNGLGPNANGQPSELQDDVRAWIRGCRDVLECAQAGADAIQSLNGTVHKDIQHETLNDEDANHVEDDDWGDFQTPPRQVA